MTPGATCWSTRRGRPRTTIISEGLQHTRPDPRPLRQLLVNLIGNALKFTDEGSVELSVHRDGEGLRFVVRDTGRGISPQNLERVIRTRRG